MRILIKKRILVLFNMVAIFPLKALLNVDQVPVHPITAQVARLCAYLLINHCQAPKSFIRGRRSYFLSCQAENYTLHLKCANDLQ